MHDDLICRENYRGQEFEVPVSCDFSLLVSCKRFGTRDNLVRGLGFPSGLVVVGFCHHYPGLTGREQIHLFRRPRAPH